MPVYQLTDEDFFLLKSKEGKVLLCINVPGLAFVFFRISKGCPICTQFKPVFDALAREFPNCKFLMIDVLKYPAVRKMSYESVRPIKGVPMLFFYVEKKPFLEYADPRKSYDLVSRFLLEAISRAEALVKRPTAGKTAGRSTGRGGTASEASGPKKKCVKRADGTTVCTEIGVPYNTPPAVDSKTDTSMGIPYNVVCDKATGMCYITEGEIMKSKGVAAKKVRGPD